MHFFCPFSFVSVKNTYFWAMKKSISKNIKKISLLTAVVLIALIITQIDILKLNTQSHRFLFVNRANTALHQALIDINYETCAIIMDQNPEIEITKDTLSDTGYDMGDNYIWPSRTISDYMSIRQELLGKNIAFDYTIIGFESIDSIIRHCLRNEGINNHYELGIYSQNDKKFIFQSTGNYDKKLMNSECNHKIFALDNNGRKRVDDVILYFPRLNFELWFHDIAAHFYLFFILFLLVLCLVASNRMIKKQDEIANMKNNFINNMTHEIKTPVSTISLACQVLQDPTIKKDAALTATYIGIINEENERIRQMTEEVLNSVRFSRAKTIPKPQTFSVHETIQSAVKMHAIAIKRRNGIINMELKAQNDSVYGDFVHVGNAVSNLIDNAIKYSDKPPVISVTTENIGHQIAIHVKDQGIGIPKKDQSRIFEEFYRVDTGNLHNVKGHGLGLNYVKTVSEFHNGNVKVDSEPGKGSTFTITLPLQDKTD